VNKKGIAVAAFFGTIMLTSLAAGVLLNNTPPLIDDPEDAKITITGTPADNFPDVQRARFCGSGDAKSTSFVKEYAIPTVCTNPLAIVTDHDGNVWFAQTNTGKLGKFDPATESFTEFDNPLWPKKGRSMMWGIDYSPDGALWYTDESYDSIWRFSIEDQKYQRIDYPSEGNTLPQKLKVDGSQIVINDFTGNKITFLDPAQSDDNLRYMSLPSPINGTVTSDFAIDAKNNVWYTNWLYQQGGGVLVKFDQENYRISAANTNGPSTMPDYFEIFQLPSELLTPNGVTISGGNMIWIADTSSSAIFSFDPMIQQFTHYVTSDPKKSTYGNSTGVIKSPISRPYWIETNPTGQIVFNEQTSNSISIMDPTSESLVEYMIPSKNPEWGDCSDMDNCGLAQVFDFTVNNNKIWFTEWAENNIGVVDTSIALPFGIELDSKDILLKAGESKNLSFTISPLQDLPGVSLILSDPYNFMNATSNISGSFQLDSNSPKPIDVTISTSDASIPGKYKVLLGAQIEDVSISKFVTVTIEP
jgi:virginiamycin B lyase